MSRGIIKNTKKLKAPHKKQKGAVGNIGTGGNPQVYDTWWGIVDCGTSLCECRNP